MKGFSSVLGIVSHEIFPARMGDQKCTTEFYAHLSNNAQVTLAIPKTKTPIPDVPYPVLAFLYDHSRGFLNFFKLLRLGKLIKEKNIDLLIIERSYFGWLGLLLRKITKKPVVIHSHNIESHRLRDLQKSWWRIYEWYEKKVHRYADHSFFITEEDMSWAIANWELDKNRCSLLTYGTDILQAPSAADKSRCRSFLVREHQLDPDEKLFLFNGSFNYLPNTDALRIIIAEIIPLLLSINYKFRIFICGSDLSDQWQKVLSGQPNIVYKGFIEKMEVFTMGVDCFINPVTLGSGIKTKLVEAIALNQRAISTVMGARGIPKEMSGTQLAVVEDYDWASFAAAMANTGFQPEANTPELFYRMFNWDRLVRNALLSLRANE